MLVLQGQRSWCPCGYTHSEPCREYITSIIIKVQRQHCTTECSDLRKTKCVLNKRDPEVLTFLCFIYAPENKVWAPRQRGHFCTVCIVPFVYNQVTEVLWIVKKKVCLSQPTCSWKIFFFMNTVFWSVSSKNLERVVWIIKNKFLESIHFMSYSERLIYVDVFVLFWLKLIAS